MNKAEEKAKERYWLEPCNIDTQNKYHAYIEGYQQAEKDLALTWEDIKEIYLLCNFIKKITCGATDKDFKEVLNRFNKQKGEKI